MIDVKVGDTVTITGEVTFIKNGYIEMTTSNHDQIWVKIEDIKTLRPKIKTEDNI